MKGAFRFVLFGGAVLLLGLMIRGCNKQFGWYEANSIVLQVEKPLEESKFHWYMVDEFNRGDDGAIPLPITYGQMLYDTALVKPFPQVEDENRFILVYDSVWVFPFIHYKLRGQTQHNYEFLLSMEDSVPYADIVIDGPYYESYHGKFTPLSDSIVYLPYDSPDVYDEPETPSEQVDPVEPVTNEVRGEEMESEETDEDATTTTDHDAR